jgi:hypothetical protein
MHRTGALHVRAQIGAHARGMSDRQPEKIAGVSSDGPDMRTQILARLEALHKEEEP